MERKETETRTPGEGLSGFSRIDGPELRTFIGFFVSAGLVNATIAAVLICRLPQSHWLPLSALVVRATLYVLVGAAAGVMGAWFYWRRFSHPYRLRSPISFAAFSLICAAGWVWVPAGVLLSTQDSNATVLIGLLCGASLGAGLRKGIPIRRPPAAQLAPAADKEIFSATLERAPHDSRGYLIAICVYLAAYAQHEGERLIAALLCALAAFLFVWNWKQPAEESDSRRSRKAGWRLARSAALAILVTAWALMLGLAHRNASRDAAFAADTDASQDQKAHSGKPARSSLGPGGFESLILWPFPPKKQIIPPIPAPANFLGPEKSRPLVIRFDGAYWYFQPPDTRPGRTAHEAHGTPLAVNIQSNNFFPLMMEAHQRLLGPVRLSRCAEIDVEIQNRDNVPGVLSLAVLLGDSALPTAPALFLGKKEIETSLPSFFSYKTAPVFETLRFAIPATAPIRKFDEITVMLLPDIEHAMLGPKVAIEQFQLSPR